MNRPGWTVVAMLRMNAGLIVWVSAFVFLYAGFSLGCQLLAPSPEDGLANAVTVLLLVLALFHMAVLAALVALWWKRPVAAADGESDSSRRIRHRVEGLVLACSMAGLVWVAFPVLMVAPCTG
jgi:hypothetical protein